MRLQHDLLKQARQLATREPKKPRQASLRRAVSAAYYAVFHLLVDDATRLMLTAAPRRKELRLIVRRAFVHAHMYEAARGFGSGGLSPKIAPALDGQAIQPALRNVAASFVELQQARHDADYDTGRSFTRAETLDLVEQAEQAFEDWRAVKGSIQADAFLMALLVYRSLRG